MHNLPCAITPPCLKKQADYKDHTMRFMILSSAVVSTLAGTAGMSGVADGTGTAAYFNAPYGVAMDGPGTFVIVVREYDGRGPWCQWEYSYNCTLLPNCRLCALSLMQRCALRTIPCQAAHPFAARILFFAGSIQPLTTSHLA